MAAGFSSISGPVALGVSIVLGSVAQILLRRGMAGASQGTSGTAPGGLRRYASPCVMGWACCFAVATVLWLIALRHMPISYAYPLLGTSYVLVALLAMSVLRERISRQRWIGVLIIVAGAILIARSR